MEVIFGHLKCEETLNEFIEGAFKRIKYGKNPTLVV